MTGEKLKARGRLERDDEGVDGGEEGSKMDFKGLGGEATQRRGEEPNLNQERESRALDSGGCGVRFLAAIREENLKTSGPVVWPLLWMDSTACPLNFVQC